jgi:hypothetical protein
MTAAEWLACTEPTPMLEFLGDRASSRKLRLLACACCRKVWGMLTHENSRQVVEVAERFADGQATQAELTSARASAETSRGEAEAVANNAMRGANYRDYGWYVQENPRRFAAIAAVASANDSALQAATVAAENSINAASAAKEANNTTWYDYVEALWWGNPISPKAQGEHDAVLKAVYETWCALIRDIFGNPILPPPLTDPTWLTWNGSTVVRLAQAIYEERGFDLLPLLADALEEAGCTSADILAHCRTKGEHVRGCWVVDLLLGKE